MKQKHFTIQRIGKRKKREVLKKKNATKVALKYTGLAILTLMLTVAVYFKEQTGEWFKASVLEAPLSFNGTVYPVVKVPNWTHWKGDNHTTLYSQVPESELIDLPAYDPALLAFPNEKLEWGNPAHDIIRNTKITYSVVYLASYKKSHTENTGSHLAFDVRMPIGTPLYAIANAKVVKVSMIENGFGHHVVLKMINVPDPDNPGKLTTFYAGYNHMDEISVKEGQNVLKGQPIGTSGNTGTSTTPHLHLQIDRESSEWHPYWPFTWTESQEAGLSFFEAVNAGLGMDKAKMHTVHPLDFINANLTGGIVVSNRLADIQPANPEPTLAPPKQTDIVETVEDLTDITVDLPATGIDTSLFTFKIEGETMAKVGSGLTLLITDERDQIKTMRSDDEIKVHVSGVGKSLQPTLHMLDFNGGVTRVTIKSEKAGTTQVAIGKSTVQLTFIEQVKIAAGLAFKHDGRYQKNIVEKVKIVAIDEDGNPTPSLVFSGVVSITVKEGQGIVTPNTLNVGDFVNGMTTVRLKVPNEQRVILRAQNGALVGESTALTAENSLLFTDIKTSHLNYDAIRYLKDEAIIGGYPDGSFQPDRTVNRVEALKMLMLAFNVEAGAAHSLSFTDTDNGAWYAGTLSTAVAKGIVKGYPDGSFKPAQTVNVAEYLKILFNSSDTTLQTALVANPYDDVPREAWFAGYAYAANKKNVVDTVNNLLHPADGMTRAQVAETIYRMKMIEQNSWVAYEK